MHDSGVRTWDVNQVKSGRPQRRAAMLGAVSAKSDVILANIYTNGIPDAQKHSMGKR